MHKFSSLKAVPLVIIPGTRLSFLGKDVIFIGMNLGQIIPEYILSDPLTGRIHTTKYRTDLVLSPLCYIEDRPVYPGDVVRHKISNQIGTVKDSEIAYGIKLILVLWDNDGNVSSALQENLTYNLDIFEERWMNIYSGTDTSAYLHKTKAEADSNSGSSRIDCIKISWKVHK